MSAPTSPAAQQRSKRTRKSIAHFPSGDNLSSHDNGIYGFGKDTAANKKSRSKSLGPGGLEALREGSGNRQKTLPAIRSILKPTIPLSPPKPIPPRTPRTESPGRSKARASLGRPVEEPPNASPRALENALSPSTGRAEKAEVVALRTEEEQQREARQRERQEAIRRRDERRKSLANRRVSFAPEATLHTWAEVELNEDATTSSEATNSTRRQSSGNTLTSNFTQGTQHAPNPDMDPPSTPPVQDEQASSPEHQRDIHQKKRRRSSTIPPMNSSNPDALSSSPTSSMADDVTQQSFVSGIGEDDNEDDVSDTDTYRDDESTAMDIDEDDDEVDAESTSRSVGSGQADDTASSSSSGQLDARLRQAIEQASTQNLDLPDLDQIRRNENLIEADFEADQQAGEEEDEGMDMTEAVGGILQNQPSSPFETLLVEQSPQRRSSRIARRRSSGANTTAEDETMELTTAIGHIRRASTSSRRESGATVATEDEDMSMELTNVIGGVIGSIANEVEPDDDEGHDFQPDLTAQMDMTTVYGRILSPVTERTEPSTEASESMDFTTAVGAIKPSHTQAEQEPEDATATMTMDVTKAIGSILPNDLRSSDRMTGRMLMKEETEHGQLLRSSLIREPSYPALPPAEILNAPEPLVRIHTTTPPQSPEANTTTPRSEGRQMTPARGTATPTHQATPQPAPRPTTPSKTPPNRNIAMRRTSPKKLFSQSTRERPVSVASPASSSAKRRRRATIEPVKPPMTETTQTLNTARIGIEKTGLGSPTVAELLDRRTSIGESASTFTPQGPASRGVHFQDPQEIERDVDQERANELHRESGRDALEKEADVQQSDKDVTANLRDMIQSMTPKKKKDFKGRKSLAVGSALGLLGKRPVELDQEDEDDSPKRLKGPEHSPVKSIRLPAPPSKAETTGRLGKLGRVSLGPVSGNVGTPRSSEKSQAKATTPKDQARFRDAGMNENVVPPISFNQRDRGISPELQQEDDEEEDGPIQLQDFLNMINVRFMDLETSKRRHTILPQGRSSSSSATDERRLVDCVAASVSTVPMLELYQHSCRELKKYISEGRNIVREIEQDTYDDNPALFREYISAAPDMRAIMDNQFKNVKSHARLLSKAMWYEWRMKLLEGLRDGLVRIGDGLADDGKLLSKQEELLNSTVPPLVSERQQLVEKEARLRQHAEELASCDQEELKGAREKLRNADAELIEKRKLLAELQAQKSAQDVKLTKLTERKQQCLAEIETSRRLNDEYRGWKPAEVAALKTEVDAFEKSSGWTITNASSDERLEMSYRGIISLTLKPTSFQPASANPDPIEVSLIGGKDIISTEREFHDDETKSVAVTTQQQFFLDLLRRRFASLDQPATKAQDVLRFVARTWALADGLHGGVSDLALGYVTDVEVVNPDCIAVTANVLLRNMRTRVRARFEVTVGGEGTSLEVSTSTTAAVVYGEELKEGNMADFLAKKIVVDARTVDTAGTGDTGSEGVEFTRWANAVRELETRLIARGKKQ